jgi:hypothetical protein
MVSVIILLNSTLFSIEIESQALNLNFINNQYSLKNEKFINYPFFERNRAFIAEN